MRILLRLALIGAVVIGALKWRESQTTEPKEADTAPIPEELIRQHKNSLVFAEGKSASGSGFICSVGAKSFLFTNQHVVAGNPAVVFTALDQTPIKVGQAAAAVGHDLISFELLSKATGMEIMREVEVNAAVGDAVAVLGNPKGDRVIKPLAGKIVGIGPDRIEVSAEFVQGNSGSPVIHLKTGKVIGIATYAKVRAFDSLTGKRKNEPEVRRFAYRLDSVKQWQPVNWIAYNAEFQVLERIRARSSDLLKALTAKSKRELATINYEDSAVRVVLARFWSEVRGEGLIKTSLDDAVKNCLHSLRNLCEADIEQAKTRVVYDYFRSEFLQEQKLRADLYGEFQKILKVLRGE